MKLAFDTYYIQDRAKTVCISFKNWADPDHAEVFSEILENREEYTPGEFYKRELPCILSLLKNIDLKEVDVIIVDGFVYLDDSNKPGLGAHLYNSLEGKIPVIGVAKTNFATIELNKRALIRGESKNPLYITSIGMDIDEATKYIASMHGEFRIPGLLKKLDGFTRDIQPSR